MLVLCIAYVSHCFVLVFSFAWGGKSPGRESGGRSSDPEGHSNDTRGKTNNIHTYT